MDTAELTLASEREEANISISTLACSAITERESVHGTAHQHTKHSIHNAHKTHNIQHLHNIHSTRNKPHTHKQNTENTHKIHYTQYTFCFICKTDRRTGTQIYTQTHTTHRCTDTDVHTDTQTYSVIDRRTHRHTDVQCHKHLLVQSSAVKVLMEALKEKEENPTVKDQSNPTH